MDKQIKKIIFTILECAIVFTIAYFLCKFFNKDNELIALHKDDVENYVYYLENPSLSDWILKRFDGRMHYRPVFYIVLFLIFHLITGNIPFTLTINFIISAIISTTIYFLCRSLKISRLLSFIVVVLYTISPFSYYQIYQAIGCVEALALIFSLIILVLCIKSTKVYDKNAHIYFISIAIFALLLIFSHERYFPIYVTIIIALFMNKYLKLKHKLIYLAIYIIELVSFFVIRHYFLNIWVPRGTACTMLLEHMNLERAGMFIRKQIMYIFGIHLDEGFLSAKNFFETDVNMQVCMVISAVLAFLLFIIYIVKKIIYAIVYKKFVFKEDILVHVFIFFLILQSSLTIRLEMRWVYASFTAYMIYLAYIITYFTENFSYKYAKKTFIVVGMYAIFVTLRIVSSFYLRGYYYYIHILNEQFITNSLAKSVLDKYSVDDVKKNKKIALVANKFDVITDTELAHFFDPFDGKLNNRQILYLEEDEDKLSDIIFNEKDTILLIEQPDLTYMEYNEWAEKTGKKND